MALLALSAPSSQLFGPAGTILPTSGTALTGDTGLTVPWVSGLVVVVFSGATGAGATALVNPLGTFSNPSVTLAASGIAIFGPLPQEFSAAATGLVQVNVTTVTTASASAFLLPAGTGANHNPFLNAGLTGTAFPTDY